MRVKMNDTLRSTIKQSVLQPLIKRYQELQESLVPDIDNFIEDALGPELAAARKALPQSMLNTMNGVRFKVAGLTPALYLSGNNYVYGVPLAMYQYGGDGEITGPTVDKHRATFDEMQKIIERRALLEKEIPELLAKATTLQDVHKVWPSVLDYVPVDVQQKFHKKAERRKTAAAPELEMKDEMALEITKLRLGAV